MEELIFIGVLIVFSILEAVARGKKGRQAEIPPPEEWEWEGGEQREERAEVESSDRRFPKEMRPEYRSPYRQPSEQPDPEEAYSLERTSSEEMVPEALWEEIVGAARRRAEEVLAPVPAPPPPPRPTSARRPVPPPARRLPDESVHRVHLTHAEYGTDPSSRSDSGRVGAVTARPLPAGARGARELLRGGSGSLRQAMILKEVLGPPVSLSADGPGSDLD